MDRKIRCLPLVMAACLFLASCGEETQTPPALLTPVGVSLDTVLVTRGDVEKITFVEGAVSPASVSLSFTGGGILKEVSAVVGDVVTEGQVLASLDQEALDGQISDLRYGLSVLQKSQSQSVEIQTLAVTQAQLQLQKLKESGADSLSISLAEIEVQRQQASLSQLKDQNALAVDRMNHQISTLTSQKENENLTAPFSGRVVYVTGKSEGDSVTGSDTVVTLVSEEEFTVVTPYISMSDLRQVESVEATIGKNQYLLTEAPFDQSEYLSKVLAGASLSTEFLIEGDTFSIKAGDYAGVFLIQDRSENVLMVPTNSVYQESGGYYVYLVKDGTRIKTSVTVGVANDAFTEIESGLSEGDEVYVKG